MTKGNEVSKDELDKMNELVKLSGSVNLSATIMAFDKTVRESATKQERNRIVDLIEGISPEELAVIFHAYYEKLAPYFNYETKKESKKKWKDVPENNRKLMMATCEEVLKELKQRISQKEGE